MRRRVSASSRTGPSALLKRTETLVRVVGYTDDIGTPQRNGGISLDRAVKVRQELIDRGIAAQRLSVVGRQTVPTFRSRQD